MEERELRDGEEFGDDELPERDDDETTPCGSCGRAIYEGADRCPRCGEYRVAHAAAKRSLPAWIWIGIVAALAVLLIWAFR